MSAERRVRTLLRAWPRPDRAERGDEIVGTSLDLLPAGTSHLPVLLAVNLVIGGLQARWRMRPPVWRWVHYRMGGRLPARWHRWMLNDLTSPGWRRRMVASRVVAACVGVVVGVATVQWVQHPVGGTSDVAFAVPVVAGAVLGSLSRSRKDRDRQLVRNGYGWPTADDPPWPPPPAPTTSDGRGRGAEGVGPA